MNCAPSVSALVMTPVSVYSSNLEVSVGGRSMAPPNHPSALGSARIAALPTDGIIESVTGVYPVNNTGGNSSAGAVGSVVNVLVSPITSKPYVIHMVSLTSSTAFPPSVTVHKTPNFKFLICPLELS